MVAKTAWYLARIGLRPVLVIVILFNIITKPQLVVIRSRGSSGVSKYLGGKTFYDYKKYKLSLLVCGLQ